MELILLPLVLKRGEWTPKKEVMSGKAIGVMQGSKTSKIPTKGNLVWMQLLVPFLW